MEYLIQDARQTVGNSLLWWRRGGGYTTWLREAAVFREDELPKLRDSDRVWPVAVAHKLARSVVDMECVPCRDPASPIRAWRAEANGIAAVVFAASRSRARYVIYRAATDAGYRLRLPDVRVRRLRALDGFARSCPAETPLCPDAVAERWIRDELRGEPPCS